MRVVDALDAVVLRAVAGSAAGLCASELIQAVGVHAFMGASAVAQARRASAALLSLADAGLLVRSAGRTARYSITDLGLKSLGFQSPGIECVSSRSFRS